MSRKGNCCDNAPGESFSNSLKNERLHGTKYAARADAEGDMAQYVDVFCNWSYCYATVGHSSPIQFLQGLTRKHAGQQSKAA